MNFLKSIFVSTLSLFSVTAFAAGPDLGFPLGEKSKLHTNLSLGVGYDSNPGRDDEGRVAEGVKSRVSPSIAISVPGSAFSLGINGGLNIDQFVDGAKPCGRGAGGDTTATCLGGYAGFSIRGGGSNSVLGFEIDGGLVATPTDVLAPPAASADGSTSNEVRLMTDLGTDEVRHPATSYVTSPRFVLRPGGGALEFRLGYGLKFLNYEGLGDEQRHSGNFEAKLRFLPRTAVVMNADFSTWQGTGSGAAAGSEISSTPYNLTVGLRGQLTQRIQVDINGGYGDPLTEDEQFAQQGFITRSSLRYTIAEGMKVELGYSRMIEPSLRVYSYVYDRPHINASFTVAERLNMGLAASYEWREFATGAKDNVALAGLRADYQFFDFLRAGLSYQFMDNSPDNENSTGSGDALETFTRQIFMLNISLNY